ncbi:cytochrome P450 4C1-like [Periplaneta americana]|uniref:cytochrome P450 4C1-like n=1 Tax=Periplaneta americana TaxID=6978 RepID=UPI0037E7802E
MDALVLVLAGVLFVIACRLFLHRRIRVQFARKVDLIPGPVAYPFIGSIGPLLFKKNNDLFAEFLKIIGQQKPIFRMWFGGQPEVYLTRPEHVEVMLSSTRNLQKGFVYKFLHSWLGTGLLTATGQKWFTHRKMITPTFHFKILDSFVEVFAEKSEILVEKLQKEIRSKGFDVYPYITLCALDIICETAMGTPIFAQHDADSEYVKALYELSEVVVQRIHKPWLHSPLFFNLSQLGKRHKHCLKILHGFTNRVIQERKRESQKSKENSHTVSESEDDVIGNKRRKAFLDLLLETTLDGRTMTDEELREEVDTFMFEGHDTTSAGMCWALYMLGLHPDVQDKAYEEQQRIFQDSGRAPTMKDLSDMKYLEQVIKESLRLYPSVPAFSRLLTEDIQIDNYTIPVGCALKAHVYSLHRNPDQFPNPEKFDPDNFLPERIVKRHPYAYVPFSAGPRNCIGQKFAILEEKTVLSYILRKYKLRSLDQREDIKEVAELILRPENGIRLCITPRDV